jgi:restriction system protein
VLRLVEEARPDRPPRSNLNVAAQLNQFGNTMQDNDLVVVPLKAARKIAIGEVVGSCALTAEGHPMRPVRWVKPDAPRDMFLQDLLFRFGAQATVCEISKGNALRRVEAVINTDKDPGDKAGRDPAVINADKPPGDDSVFDLEEIARDQIEKRIASAFTGHNFTRLVAEILKPQGYVVNVSQRGPDKGIGIVAGRGGLGFEAPRMVVQVKSGDFVADHRTLQALIGAVEDTQANQGLLVCWGGFKNSVSAVLPHPPVGKDRGARCAL